MVIRYTGVRAASPVHPPPLSGAYRYSRLGIGALLIFAIGLSYGGIREIHLRYEVEEAWHAADKARSERSHQVAIGGYSRALSLLESQLWPSDDDRAAILYERGLCRSKSGDHAAATIDLESSNVSRPNSVGTLIDLSNEYIWANRARDAIVLLDAALALDPSSYNAFNNRALAKRLAGDLDGSLVDARRAIELDPKGAKAHYNLGVVLELRDELDSALRAYDAAIEFDQDFGESYYRRAWIRVKRREYAGALADITQSIRIHPDNERSYLCRAIATANTDPRAAIIDLTRYLKLHDEDWSAHFTLGCVHSSISEFGVADAALSRAIELNPDLPKAWSYRASARLSLGRVDDAIADATRAIELDHLLAAAYRTRASALAQLGLPEAAAADDATYRGLTEAR